MSIAPADVRNYLGLEAGSGSAYSDATINSNIGAALSFLERATQRYFTQRTGLTLTISTSGATQIDLPGVSAVTSATRAGNPLEADVTYWLQPDAQQSGLYTGMSFGPYGGDYRAYSEWFDRNLDQLAFKYGGIGNLPNDLVLVVNAGYADPVASVPEFGIAWKVLAAWLTKRPDAVLTSGTATPDGSVISLEDLPAEVSLFIQSWRLGSHSAVSLG